MQGKLTDKVKAAFAAQKTLDTLKVEIKDIIKEQEVNKKD